MSKFVLCCFLFSFNLFAASDLEIKTPIIKLPPPGMVVTAMFVNIINHSDKDMKIVKANGSFAKNFELHNMFLIPGQMKMRKVEFITLTKKSTTELKPGGLHIMIFDTNNPLKEGEHQKIILTLDNKAEIEVDAVVGKM